MLKLNWNEPAAVQYANVVDYYLLTVNQMSFNVTETATDVSLLETEGTITVTVRASNCIGSTPTTSFHFHHINHGMVYSSIQCTQKKTTTNAFALYGIS